MFKERLISGLLGCMFIIIFQPFSLLQFGSYRWVLTLGICACIVGSILLVECLLTWVLRMPHEPQRGMKYLVRRNAIFQVLNILGMTLSTVLFIDRFACKEGVDNHLSWATVGWASLIYVGCSIIIGLYWRNVYMKRDFQHRLEEAQYLNGILKERQRAERQKQAQEVPQPSQPHDLTTPHPHDLKTSKPQNLKTSKPQDLTTSLPHTLTLTGATKESLTLEPQDFIYAESNGNYVHIHYFKEGVAKDAMLRSSITQIEKSFSPYTGILRCHRAFVANLKHVTKLESHGSTLQLYYKAPSVFVPVSKTYIQIVKERIVDPVG